MIKNSKAVFFSVVVSHSALQNNKVYSVLSPFLSCTIIHSLSHTVILYFTFIHVFFFSHKLPLPYIHYRAVHTHTHHYSHATIHSLSHKHCRSLSSSTILFDICSPTHTHTHTIILFYKQHQCFSYAPVYYNRGCNSIW